jgi:hypothetical protein
MANNTSKRLLARRIVRSNEKGEAIDLLLYKSIIIQVRLYQTGSAGTISLQHSSVNEESHFVTLGTAVSLSAGTGEVQPNSNFLRFVRFVTSGDVAGSPEVSFDIVAKEYGENQAFRILQRRVVRSDETSEVSDLGPYKSISASIRVAVAGSAGTIELQHAATNEPTAFKTIGTAVNLNATTVNVQYHGAFLRYMRWLASGGVGGSPEVVIDLIGKEF